MVVGLIKDIPRFLIGLFSVAISLLLLLQQNTFSLVVILASYLIIVCIFDTLTSKIPNYCSCSLVVGALIYNSWLSGLPGLGLTFLGFVVGLGLLLIPYLLGGIGGGDVKALAAMGALLGPMTIVQVFFYIALFGGLFSMLHFVFSRNFLDQMNRIGRTVLVFAGTRDVQVLKPQGSDKLRFPYASAFAFGFFSYAQWGSIFSILA